MLEYIKKAEKVIMSLATILKKGGLMYHSIGLADHYDFNNPFLFYKYSDSVWDKYMTKEGLSYTNRLRYDYYLELFAQAGLKVVKEETIAINWNPRIKLASRFAVKDPRSLSIVEASFLLQKKENLC